MPDNAKKVVIIVGAGATRSDAVDESGKRKRGKILPPLDVGFFADAKKLKESWYHPGNMLKPAIKYMQKNHGVPLLHKDHDSLERVMSIVHSDVSNPIDSDASASKAGDMFVSLLRIFCAVIAYTTTPLMPSPQSHLYGILQRYINGGYAPADISVISFNQDIQVERMLWEMQTRRDKNAPALFSFPHCYQLPEPALAKPAAQPHGQYDAMQVVEMPADKGGIAVLKPHGSLNWMSSHNSSEVEPRYVLNPERHFYIIEHRELYPRIPVVMSLKKKYTYGMPVIVPPVAHKAGVLHRDFAPVWQYAAKALKNATDVVVFGYSCPKLDMESENLIGRSLRRNRALHKFSVIDPSSAVWRRYADITGLDNKLRFYRSASRFLAAQKGV